MIYRSTLRRVALAMLALVTAISLAGGLRQDARAERPSTPRTYYVSLSGNDTNPGTQTAPFRSFTKATSVLQPGDALYIAGGVYHQRLSVTNSGASGYPITIQPAPGDTVIIDLLSQADSNVSVTGSYVIVQGLELRNSSLFCVYLKGTHNIFRKSVVHDCYDMGINTAGQDETISGNTVYHASLRNAGFNLSGGWASGIKVRVGGDRILIANNRTYNNYGEGICITRGANVTVRGNISYDNYSDNIYIDNSYNVVVARNFTYNHPNNGFGAGGIGANNISIGEEYYSGWGAKLSNIKVINNIAFNGSHGVLFSGNSSGTAGGGLKYSTIAYNTLWGSVNSEIYIVYDTGQTGNVISNNIVQQPGNKLVLLDRAVGVAFSNNFWVNGLPPLYARKAGDKTGDVQLVSPPGFDASTFRLSSGSPAIDAGAQMSSVANDYAGAKRPSGSGADMGAFEFTGP